MSTKSHIPKTFPAITLETLMVVRWRSVYDTHTHIHWHTRARARGISGGLSNVKKMMKNTVRDLQKDESLITRPYHSFHISYVITTLTIRDTFLHDTRWRVTAIRIRFQISKTRTNFTPVNRSTSRLRLSVLLLFRSSMDVSWSTVTYFESRRKAAVVRVSSTSYDRPRANTNIRVPLRFWKKWVRPYATIFT